MNRCYGCRDRDAGPIWLIKYGPSGMQIFFEVHYEKNAKDGVSSGELIRGPRRRVGGILFLFSKGRDNTSLLEILSFLLTLAQPRRTLASKEFENRTDA